MSAVALVPHHLRPEARRLAADAIAWLEQRGHAVRVPTADAERTGLEAWAVPDDALAEGLSLAMAVGGDGTILRTVALVCAHQVPVLGVNVGQLGYLSAVEPSGMLRALERVFADDFAVEDRMTLEVEVVGTDGGSSHFAMNEMVVEKTEAGHTVRLAVSVNDGPFLTIAADGMIVATPTGSTAYNLSARGPIASPRLRALVVTPVSPHTLFDRSLVLDDEETVCLEVLDGRSAALVVDGRTVAPLSTGDRVVCRAGRYDARLISMDGRDFHQILKAKFALADR